MRTLSPSTASPRHPWLKSSDPNRKPGPTIIIRKLYSQHITTFHVSTSARFIPTQLYDTFTPEIAIVTCTPLNSVSSLELHTIHIPLHIMSNPGLRSVCPSFPPSDTHVISRDNPRSRTRGFRKLIRRRRTLQFRFGSFMVGKAYYLYSPM